MYKKLIVYSLLMLFIMPLPAMASFTDDIKAFEAKYSDIYGTIDPALTAKMESYLEDVVVYVVDNYDAGKSINTQIQNAVASVLLIGDTYKNDLMPFLLEQQANQDQFSSQLTEMQAIVRKEALARIAAQNNSSGSGSGNTGNSGSPGNTGTTVGGSTPTNPVTPLPTETASKFTDLPASHWAKADVEKMVSMGLVKGVSATEFAPERNITRAEFSALLIRALGITPGTQLTGKFTDVPASEWYFSTVNAAAEAGLVSGYTANTFGPNDPVTREQMAVMISRALAYKEKTTTVTDANASLQSFTDKPQISSWALEGVAAAVDKGIIKGRSATQFAPLEKATRAEAAVMILRLYSL
jgi:hypothetical protein